MPPAERARRDPKESLSLDLAGPTPPTNSYVVATRHFAFGVAAIYGLLRLSLSTLIAQNFGSGVIDDVWFAAETGSL